MEFRKAFDETMETTTVSSSAVVRREGEEGDKNEESISLAAAAAAASLERAAVNRVVHAMREYHRSCDREIERRRRNGRKAIAMMRMKNEETEKDDDAFVASPSSDDDDDTKIVGPGTMTTKKNKKKKKRNVWLNWKALERVYEDHDRKSRESVAKNQRVFDALLATFSNAEHVPEHLRVRSDFSNVPARERPPATPASEDAEKARYVLKNLVRDWSEEGKEEREKSHDVLVRHLRDVVFKEQLSKIDRMYEGGGANSEDAARPRVLVPGAGLGRLVYEFAKAGFETEGNEFSYYMLFGASFLLNCCSEKRPYEIVPYWHSPLNHLSREDQYRSVSIPDESPGDHLNEFKPGSSMAMCAGDFCEVYGKPEYQSHFDAVACCFFLDTAKNILDYLDTIRFCLKKGGTLTSIGPLLWHWVEHSDQLGFGASPLVDTSKGGQKNDDVEDEDEDISIEVSLEDLIAFAEELGFRLDVKRHPLACPYATDRKSMHRTVYDCAFLSFTLEEKYYYYY